MTNARGARAALVALACAISPAHAQSPRAASEGVWTTRVDLGPRLRGDLSVSRESGGWRADLAGISVHSPNETFDFPDQGGRYIGHGDRGWWVQPPGLPGMAYATPVHLRRDAAGVLRGVVQPLPQTFTLHVSVFRDEQGAWTAAFRNPEFNLNGGSSRFSLEDRDGGMIARARSGDAIRDIEVTKDGRLKLDWPPLPQPLELARTDRSEPGYLPRAPVRYVYQKPPRTGDGWRTGRARDVGFDENALAAFVQGIVASDPAAQRPRLLHSVLVVRRGRLVLEEYFHGYDRETPHDLRSAGKTLTSLLLGVAIRQGRAISPETGIYEAVRATPPDRDPRRSGVTLATLMTHTSGLACDDNSENSPGAEGAMQGQSAQPDWRRFALDLPMANAPGARYAYCSAGMNLVGAAIQAAAGEQVFDLFERSVARPLDFGLYHWNLDPAGEGYLGGGVYMRPRDLAKIGQLYLDGGVWNGRRILDRAWVERSTAAHVTIDEISTGMDAARFAAIATRGADGFAWHRYGVRVGDRRVESYEASGNGGQFLIVVPAYDLVVVLTGGNYGQGGIWTKWRDDIVGGQIIAALKR